MEQKNMEKNQEVLERTAETLEALTFSIFIDRRRFMEDGVPARYVDSFIRYKMKDIEDDISGIDPEEFWESFLDYANNYSEQLELSRKASREGNLDAEGVMSPFEEMEWKLGSICFAKRGLAEMGENEEQINLTFAEQAREFQEYIDGLDQEEFDKVSIQDVLKTEVKRMGFLEKMAPHEEDEEDEENEPEPEEETEEGSRELPPEIASMFFTMSRNILEGFLEELYITKRMLVLDDLPEKEIDEYIGERLKAVTSDILYMNDEDFEGYLEGLRSELRERFENSPTPEEIMEYDEEDIDPKDVTRGLFAMIDDKIRVIMTVARGAILHGADRDDITRAIREKAVEFDELYMNMDPEEFEFVVNMKLMERIE